MNLTFRSINVGVSSARLSLSKLKTFCSWNDLKVESKIGELEMHKPMMNSSEQLHMNPRILNKNTYFSSFVSFFFDLTLATVSRTAWSTRTDKENAIQREFHANKFKIAERDKI